VKLGQLAAGTLKLPQGKAFSETDQTEGLKKIDVPT
jgi:hypothetical protein